MNTLNVLLT